MNSIRWRALLVVVVICASCMKSGRGREPAAATADPPAKPSDQPMADIPNVNDLGWMVRNSPFIFVGQVASQSTSKDGDLIVTKNELSVEQVIVGDQSRKSVRLTTLGGVVGEQAMKVSHMPEFERGARYFIFTDLDRTVYNPVTGNDAGVYRIDAAGVFTYGGQAVAGVDHGTIRMGEETRQHPDAETFVTTMADPSVSGAVTSVQRAQPITGKVISLDEFAAAIRSVARQ